MVYAYMKLQHHSSAYVMYLSIVTKLIIVLVVINASLISTPDWPWSISV